jgi:enterochelin esterase-like enzyme
LDYRVYTPPCYQQDLDRDYPVLYLIHGYGFNDDQWLRLGAGEIADQLISSGEISPLIMVMPYDRDYHILPPRSQFGEALIFDLIPEIDTNYRTKAARQYRAVGGLSRGGNWALHLGFSHWDVFSAIGGHSSPLFLTDGQLKVEDWLREIPTQQHPRIYLDIGSGDEWIDQILQLVRTLDDFSIPYEFHLFSGDHNESYWASHMEQYLRWYVKEW